MKHTENKKEFQQNFAQKVIEKVRHIFDKYMSSYRGYNELKEFMDNDDNLYNPDGSLTEEYKRKIKEVESFVSNNSIDKILEEEIIKTDNDKEVLSGIIDFVERRKEIIKKYTSIQDIHGEDFNAEHFINDLLDKNADNESEKKQILEFMEDLAERDALNSLNDDDVREGFCKVINHKGQY